MKSYRQYDLYYKNTMRLHCIADTVYEPESTDELTCLIDYLKTEGIEYHILGAGSNVILPPKTTSTIILTSSISNELLICDDRVVCGCSVKIQHLIRECQKKGFGGIEYLYSVPCNIGGAVCMNAGTGRKNKTYMSISDYIYSIEYYNPETKAIEIIEAKKADFSYRHSIFQERDWIILSVVFKFDSCSFEEVEERIKARISFVREKQSGNKPSCGSIFNKYNFYIMKVLKGLKVGGAMWSKKTANWITNDSGANYNSIMVLIGIAKALHIMSFQQYNLEVKIWKEK